MQPDLRASVVDLVPRNTSSPAEVPVRVGRLHLPHRSPNQLDEINDLKQPYDPDSHHELKRRRTEIRRRLTPHRGCQGLSDRQCLTATPPQRRRG